MWYFFHHTPDLGLSLSHTHKRFSLSCAILWFTEAGCTAMSRHLMTRWQATARSVVPPLSRTPRLLQASAAPPRCTDVLKARITSSTSTTRTMFSTSVKATTTFSRHHTMRTSWGRLNVYGPHACRGGGSNPSRLVSSYLNLLLKPAFVCSLPVWSHRRLHTFVKFQLYVVTCGRLTKMFSFLPCVLSRTSLCSKCSNLHDNIQYIVEQDEDCTLFLYCITACTMFSAARHVDPSFHL